VQARIKAVAHTQSMKPEASLHTRRCSKSEKEIACKNPIEQNRRKPILFFIPSSNPENF
jgi:hypothetical protein